LELDLALVLEAGAVLREEVRPVLGERVDLLHPVLLVAVHARPAGRQDDAHCGLALLDDHRVCAVEEDPQAIDTARMGRDHAVTQVHAEQIGIGVNR